MNLFGGMRRDGGASYGTVPGNGGPRADDKNMNVGPGHVVPAQNTHLAKQVVKKLGYDPNVKVDMNQGRGQGADIKISSKEFFLNEEQVGRMKNELGLDPEILSPDSDYNQRVTGGSTQNASDMINQKLRNGGGIYNMMNKRDLQINNNNQYPSYQDAGSTNPVQPYQRPDLSSYPYQNTVDNEGGGQSAQWIDDQGRVVYSEMGGDQRLDYTGVNSDGNSYFKEQGYVPEYDAEALKGLQSNPDYNPNFPVNQPGEGVTNLPEMTASGKAIPGSGGLPTNPLSPIENNIPSLADRQPVGLNEKQNRLNNLTTKTKANPSPSPDSENNGINPEDPSSEKEKGLTPEEQYLQDLRDKNARNAKGEKLANIGMGLWNMSRNPEDLVSPTIAPMREVVRDYEGMKLQAKKDIDRANRGSMKQMRELGMTNQMVGADANTKAQTMKANSAIWDMMNKDQMYNAANDNQRQARFYDQSYKHGLMESKFRGDFAREKGQNIANNVAQYFDVKENEFQNDAKLGGYQVNDRMDKLDDEYNKLDIPAIRASKSGNKFISRDDYYRMSDAERAHLRSLKS